jgi:hypothetical protein
MKNNFLLILMLLFASFQLAAQSTEFGLSYFPHKFYLANSADKEAVSGYTEKLPNLLSGNSIGVFFTKAVGKQQSLQFDLNFMHQRQFYISTALNNSTYSIYTSFRSINLGVSHNLYLWEYENNDNVFFSYGVSFMNMLGYTDFFNVETETKTGSVVRRETHNVLIEDDKYVSTISVTENDTPVSVTGDAKTGAFRYRKTNIGANFGLHFLHYFTDNLALTAGIKSTYYFLNPENKASSFWNTSTKYKYGDMYTSDKRGPTRMYTFGLALSVTYCFGR